MVKAKWGLPKGVPRDPIFNQQDINMQRPAAAWMRELKAEDASTLGYLCRRADQSTGMYHIHSAQPESTSRAANLIRDSLV
ncbi:hypothetical protein M378DRAFT_162895 [Amanita muscaria Koide BX008]|uniref:Uncharacterized protein n=1 Tax=Amanita muscaria (strain Koide BX008) TaxID=946122 RepID=A0A0C2TD59_AMAMK|nr:hypothetical protein M378DRAFT_162895 [Amanita muscaria Koide BX008]